MCGPDCLRRLTGLLGTERSPEFAEILEQWKRAEKLLIPAYMASDGGFFTLLQYHPRSAEELEKKLAQLPRGMRVEWQMYRTEQTAARVSMEQQQRLYERYRAIAARHGVILTKREPN